MRNSKFSIIHAADLHLGAPFKGIAQGRAGFPDNVRQCLLNATFVALDRLVDLCLKEKPLALLLAGDLYNPEGGGLKSLNALHNAFLNLEAAGIAVLLIHGNHDPASQQPPWTWPSNVHVFDHARPTTVPVFASNGKAILGHAFHANDLPRPEDLAGCTLLVHGISHYQELVTDNLALAVSLHTQQLQGLLPPEIPALGLVHCAIGEKASAGERPYAPCSIADLTQGRVDYWALGHIHKRGPVTERPLAWYSGNPQGLHINESGQKGCLKIDFTPGTQPQVEFYPLGAVEWQNLDLELKTGSSLSQLQAGIARQLCELRENAASNACLGVIVRLRLYGRTELHQWLRANLDALRASLQPPLPLEEPFIWIKDLVLATGPALNLERAARQEGLLGEALRNISALAAATPEERAGALLAVPEAPLARLFGSPALRQAGITEPGEPDLLEMLEEAALACVELLGANEPPAEDI